MLGGTFVLGLGVNSGAVENITLDVCPSKSDKITNSPKHISSLFGKGFTISNMGTSPLGTACSCHVSNVVLHPPSGSQLRKFGWKAESRWTSLGPKLLAGPKI